MFNQTLRQVVDMSSDSMTLADAARMVEAANTYINRAEVVLNRLGVDVAKEKMRLAWLNSYEASEILKGAARAQAVQ